MKSETLTLDTFYLKNNSKDTLMYSYSTEYPDTSILNNLDSSIIYPSQLHPIYVPAYLLPNFKTKGRLELFLFNIDTIQKFSWQTITSDYLVTKRYDLNYDSVEAENNVIGFP